MPDIQSILEVNKWIISPSPGDGHCLLHFTVKSWNSQCLNLPTIDLHQLKCDFFIESVKHFDRYQPFLRDGNRSTYFSGLRRYLINKSYDHEFVDIAPSVVSNVLSSDLTILNQTPSSSDVHILHLTPTTTDCNSSLVVHRKGEHYNGIVRVPSLYSGQKNESLVVSPVSSEHIPENSYISATESMLSLIVSVVKDSSDLVYGIHKGHPSPEIFNTASLTWCLFQSYHLNILHLCILDALMCSL